MSKLAKLDELSKEIDEVLEKMQTPASKKAVDDFFAMTPEELGQAALEANMEMTPEQKEEYEKDMACFEKLEAIDKTITLLKEKVAPDKNGQTFDVHNIAGTLVYRRSIEELTNFLELFSKHVGEKG